MAITERAGIEPPLDDTGATPAPAVGVPAAVVDEKLATYRRKRRFNVTAEPAGTPEGAEQGPELRFCVQKHVASHLHYDFRLEKDGVLRSWAVPRGPTLDPKEKRLAMQVEDHPIEYMEFEGTIPKGEYGGGTVMLWDLGTYEEQPGSRDGDLKFVLSGHKLHGEFALVRMKGKQKEWLLIKKTDEAAGLAVDDDHSVKSGRTLEQIASGEGALWFSDLPAASAEVDMTAMVETAMPESLEPMMAVMVEEPFSNSDWVFEPKWDGIRGLAFIDNKNVRLMSRRGRNISFQYPELAQMWAGVGAVQAILDGEIVAYDERGLPSFQVLQRRMNLENPREIEQTQLLVPVAYQAFDLLYVDGRDVRSLPLIQRKALLRRVIKTHSFLFYCDHIEEHGEAFYQAAVAQGLEGMVAKLKRSPYLSGRRTRTWLKVKGTQTMDCVIGGWTEGDGARKALGALVLGLYRADGQLQYVSHSGSGFDDMTLDATLRLLKPVESKRMPFVRQPDQPGTYHWVEPRFVCEVKYSNWTADQHLRHPVFLRLRPDKAPEDCVLDEAED